MSEGLFSASRTLLGVSLSAPNSEHALADMQPLMGLADVVELRLDLMPDFDLPRLLAARPLPVVVTCRPPREGGQFRGDEAPRLAILRRAAALGADVIDIEWDSLHALGDVRPALRMLSRHYFNEMPADFAAIHAEMAAAGADIVKLVGMARSLGDVVPVLKTLESTTVPTVAIAMGDHGLLTRILAPRFYPGAWLTYAAAAAERALAPGQIAIQELRDRYRAPEMSRSTLLRGLLAPDANERIRAMPLPGPGEPLWVPCQSAPGEDVRGVRAALAAWIDFPDHESRPVSPSP